MNESVHVDDNQIRKRKSTHVDAGNDDEARTALDRLLRLYSPGNTSWLTTDMSPDDRREAIGDAIDDIDKRLDDECGPLGVDFKLSGKYAELKAALNAKLDEPACATVSTTTDDDDDDDDPRELRTAVDSSSPEPDLHGTLKKCIDNAPVGARSACIELACRVRNIESSMGRNDIVDYSVIHYSFRSALVASMGRASKLIHKVGILYYVNKRLCKRGDGCDAATDQCPGFTTYSRRQLLDLFENRQVLYVHAKLDPKTKTIHYGVKAASFIEHYLRQQEYFSEKRAVVYLPPEFATLIDDSVLNLWEPMAATAMPMPATRDEGYIALLRFLDHMDRMLGKEEAAFNFGVKWFSNLIQFPHIAAKIMLIIVGAAGIGKTMLAETISTIMGSHLACKTSNPGTDLLGQFNGLVQGKPLVHLEELPAAALQENYNRVKDMVGGKTITIQKKHINTSEEPNVMHVLITTNAAAPADPDRRNAQFASIPEFELNEMHQAGCGCGTCKKSAPFFSSLSALMDRPQTQRIVYEFFKCGTRAPKTMTALEIPQTCAREVARFAHMSAEAQFMSEIVSRYRNSMKGLAPRTEDYLRQESKLRFTHDDLWGEYDTFQRREFSDRSRLEKRKAIAMFDAFALHHPTIVLRRRDRDADNKRPNSFIFDINKLDLHLNGAPRDDDEAAATSTATTADDGETVPADVAGAPIDVAAYVVTSAKLFIAKLETDGAWTAAADDDGHRHKRTRDDDDDETVDRSGVEQQPSDPSSPSHSVE